MTDFDWSSDEVEEEMALTVPTARVPLDLEAEQALRSAAAIITHRIDELFSGLQDSEVKTVAEAKATVDLIANARGLLKGLDGWRLWAVGPETAYVAKINSICKGIRDSAEDLFRMAKAKVDQYERWVELERRKELKRQQEEADKLQKQMEAEAEKAGVEAPLPPPPVIAEPKPTKIRTDDGASVHTRKTWAWELADLKQVPIDYLQVNSQKLNAAVKAGVRNIPGINIFEKTTTVFR